MVQVNRTDDGQSRLFLQYGAWQLLFQETVSEAHQVLNIRSL
jgi:hypothetical protein